MTTSFRCHGHGRGSTSDVWAVLADYGRLATWASGVDHSSMLTDDDHVVGAVRRAQLGRTVLTEHVTEWVDGETLAYDINGLPPIIDTASARWDLTDHDGHADIVVTITLEPANPAGRALVPALRRRMSRSYLDMIDDLSTEVAARIAVAAP